MKKHAMILALMLAAALLTGALLACANLPAGLGVPGSASSCTAKDGSWSGGKTTGIVAFNVSKCEITGLVFGMMNSGRTDIYQIWVNDKIRIKGNQFSYQMSKGGGTFSINGIFTTPTAVEGSWKLTKGTSFDSHMVTATQDIFEAWTGALKEK